MNFTERLGLALKQSGHKKTDIGRALKVTRATVHNWFAGNIKEIKGYNLIALANFLKVSPTWLGTGEGAMTLTVKELTLQLDDDSITVASKYNLLSQSEKVKVAEYIDLFLLVKRLHK